MKTISNVVKNLPGYIAYTRKAIIQVIGLLGALLALGLLPGNYSAIVATVIAVLTTILHYLTPNADAPVVVDTTNTDAGTTPVDVTTLPADTEGGKHEATTSEVPPSS